MRFFSDFYDSVQQRCFHKITGWKDFARSYYLGRLRLDILLSRNLVLTDAQLMDGAFFHEVPLTDLVNILRRTSNAHSPLVVRSRSEDLGEALLGLVKVPGKEQLEGFVFSSIGSDRERTGAMEEFKRTSASLVMDWKGIAPLLMDIGVSKDNVERMETFWASIIEFQAKKRIRVERWEKTADFKSAPGDQDRLERNLLTEEGRKLAKTAFRFDKKRSEMDTLFSSFRSAFGEEYKESNDLKEIESLYHRAYNLAFSIQHECDSFESISQKTTREIQRKSTGKYLRLPADFPNFLITLANMPNCQFQKLCRSQRIHFEKWWTNGDFDALRSGIEPFIEASDLNRPIAPPEVFEKEIITYGLENLFHISGIKLVYDLLKPVVREDFHPVRIISQRILRIAEARKANEKNH